jgi:peptide chain release factor 3
MGTDFFGTFDLRTNRFLTSAQGRNGAFDLAIPLSGPDDERLAETVSAPILQEFHDSLSLAREGYSAFDLKAFREGHLTPVLFGSALKGYSVEELLGVIADFAPSPRAQPSIGRAVMPGEQSVSGFVFKVQANMDPNHRDRIAFLRLCSGRFRRGMRLNHVRSGKALNVHSPMLFFGQERQVAEDAVAGDVIGIPNHGSLRVGDTLAEDASIRFTGLPSFAPEVLRRVLHSDAGKVKQIRQALEDLAEEGMVQVLRPLTGGHWIVGVVGILQLDVLKSRVSGEYGATIDLEPISYQTARWVGGRANEVALDAFKAENRSSLAEDRDGRLVFLARNAWELDNIAKRYPDIAFRDTCELVG